MRNLSIWNAMYDPIPTSMTQSFTLFKTNHVSYMAEYIMASIKQSRELIVRVHEILKAIFPQSHIFKVAERFLITFDPVR